MSVVLAPQAGCQTKFMNTDAKFILFGGQAGSGKSYIILLRILMHCDDPNFRAIVFRRESTQLKGQGGMWEEALSMYAPWNPKVKLNDMSITFPSGASVKFSHMQHEEDKRSHQGLQYSLIAWDELTHFTEGQFTYLNTRLRSAAEGDSYTIATCNPDPDSWVLKYLGPYLDQDGFPIEEQSGRVYYMVNDGDEIHMRDSEEEIRKEFPMFTSVYDETEDARIELPVKTFSFVRGTIFDNKILQKTNPSYLADLLNAPRVERDRLLYGNWYARPEGSSMFVRKWLHIVDEIPEGGVACRAWDKAGAIPSERNSSPDYTASIAMMKTEDGRYVVYGNYIDDGFCDKNNKLIGQFRKRAGERDSIMLKQAKHDGKKHVVVLPKDAGQAGLVEYEHSAALFLKNGFTVKQDPMPQNKSKATRFQPFCSAAENGLVSIVRNSFTPEMYNHLMVQLESFEGQSSTKLRKDDLVDAMASAYNYLQTDDYIPDFTPYTATSENAFKRPI